MTIKSGSTYRIYGKMGGMKRMSPIAGGRFVVNLIHAEMFYMRHDDDVCKFTSFLDSLQSQGSFEAHWRS